MYLITILAPLISFFLLSLFGKTISRNLACWLAIVNLTIAFINTLFISYEIIINDTTCTLLLFKWINFNYINLIFSFYYDSLVIIMLFLVTIISLSAHIYSTAYMDQDPHQTRFIAYLSLFTFFMYLLIISEDLIQLFFGWEGVGICSYLLINFWFNRIQANKSALKAIFMNKFGDLALMIGIFLLIHVYKTTNCTLLNSSLLSYDFQLYGISVLIYICLLFLIAAIGKSAQLGLHTWLPDAMEGPTPVSSLIHAATMVTAGVFLIIRCSFLFDQTPTILLIVTLIGCLTAFFSSTVGIFQNDTKKIIAYSTCSQLGYMIYACGISGYNQSIYHLFTHGFFKALLFLSAGAIIHSLSGEQDIRKMGGLYKVMPFSYISLLIGNLSLIGFPFLSGFYSKDEIIEYANINPTATFCYWIMMASICLTVLYSSKLLFFIFFSPYKNNKNLLYRMHENNLYIKIPLLILSLFSITIGYYTKELFIGLGTPVWNHNLSLNIYSIEKEFIFKLIKLSPTLYSIYTLVLLLILNYLFKKELQSFLLNFSSYIQFFNYRWYLDSLYNRLISESIYWFGYHISYKYLDKGIIEWIGPYGSYYTIKKILFQIFTVETKLIYHICGIVFISIIISLLLVIEYLTFFV